jgi:hypothetical protein
MKRKNNLDPSDNQIDVLLILGIVIIASTGYDGWGWLVAILICRHL